MIERHHDDRSVGGAAPYWVTRERPVREPGPGQILVRARAVAVNNADLGALESAFDLDSGSREEYVAGYEFAGEIAAVGAGVTGLKVGEGVFGTQPASFAQYVVSDVRHVLPTPGRARRRPGRGVAHRLITKHGALALAGFREGQTVLITGATSSIGLIGVQVARVVGAGQVLATTRSVGKRGLLERVGAQAVVVTGEQDLTETVLEATSGAGVDVVLNHVGGSTLADAVPVTRIDGHLVSIGRLGDAEAPPDLAALSSRQLTLHGVSFRFDRPAQLGEVMSALKQVVLPAVADGRIRAVVDGVSADAVAPAAEAAAVRFAATQVHTERSWLERVAALAAEGALVPTATEVFDLADAADAHRAIESGHTQGKIVLRA
jgi:NADPH2:quinone reductase